MLRVATSDCLTWYHATTITQEFLFDNLSFSHQREFLKGRVLVLLVIRTRPGTEEIFNETLIGVNL